MFVWKLCFTYLKNFPLIQVFVTFIIQVKPGNVMKVFQRLPRDLTQICPSGWQCWLPDERKAKLHTSAKRGHPGNPPQPSQELCASGDWGPQSPQYQSHWLTGRAWPKLNYHPREKELFMFLIGEASQKAIHPRLIFFLDVSRIYEKDANGESQK